MTDDERRRADRNQQIDEFIKLVHDDGWTIYSDNEWEKILARYKDRDFADQVPRPIIYFDIGVLASRIEAMEAADVKVRAELKKIEALVVELQEQVKVELQKRANDAKNQS